MKGSTERKRLRRLSSKAKLVAALGVALSVGFVAAVYAADPRLEQADGALEKAEALVLASQTGGGVPPQRPGAVRPTPRARGRPDQSCAGASGSGATTSSTRRSAPTPPRRLRPPPDRTSSRSRCAATAGSWATTGRGPTCRSCWRVRAASTRSPTHRIASPSESEATATCSTRSPARAARSAQGAARRGGVHQGSGLASCGGERGFVIDWRLTDGGVDPNNPNIPNDTAEVGIDGPGATAACTNNLHIGGVVRGSLVMRRARAR